MEFWRSFMGSNVDGIFGNDDDYVCNIYNNNVLFLFWINSLIQEEEIKK